MSHVIEALTQRYTQHPKIISVNLIVKQQLHVASETSTVQPGLRVRCEYIVTGTEGIAGRWVETRSEQDKGAAGVDGWSEWLSRCQTDRNYRGTGRHKGAVE